MADLSTATVPSFGQLDLSTLPSVPDVPAGAVPVDSVEASRVSEMPPGAMPVDSVPMSRVKNADGIPLDAVPADSVDPKKVEDLPTRLSGMSSGEVADVAQSFVERGEAIPESVREAWHSAKSSQSRTILEKRKYPLPGDKSLWDTGVGMEQGIAATVNELGRAVTGHDMAAAKLVEDAKTGEASLSAPEVSNEERMRSLTNVMSALKANSMEGLKSLATLGLTLGNRLIQDNATWSSALNPLNPLKLMTAVPGGLLDLATGRKPEGTRTETLDRSFDTQLDAELTARRTIAEVAKGTGWGYGSTGDGSAIGQQYPADAETVGVVRQNPLLDVAMWAPGGAALKGGREALLAARVLEGPAKTSAVSKLLAKPVALAGKAATVAHQVVEESPFLRAAAAGGTALAAGSEPVTAAIAALAGANTKLNLLGKAGAALSDTAAAMEGKIPPGPWGRFGASAAKLGLREGELILGGQLANAPYILGAGDTDSAANMVVGGALMHAALRPAGAMVSGLDFTRGLWKGNQTLPDVRLSVKDAGFNPEWDKAHRQVMGQTDNSSNNFVQLVRDYFGKERGEIYTMFPVDYEKALAGLAADGHISAGEAEAAKTQQGLSVKIQGEDGETRNIALSRVSGQVPGLSVGHEAGHLLESLLSPQELAHAYSTIADVYGPEQVQEYKDRHEALMNLGRDPSLPQLKLEGSQVLSEIFAEHVSAVLNSVPVETFSDPNKDTKNLSRTIYSLVARGMEKIGAKVPELNNFSDSEAPRTGLGIQPSAKLGSLIENVLAAHALDKAKLKYNTPSGKAPLTEAQKTLSPEEKIYLSGKAPKPKPAPVEELGGHPHPITADTPFGAAALTGKTAEDIVAPRHVENVARPVAPNLRITPERQNQFGEATPEQLAATHQHLDTAFAGPRHEIKPVELEYLAAKSDSGEIPNQKEREAQRVRADQLEEASKTAGLPNPLRQKYQKVAVPYGYARDDKSLVHAMSLDKVVHNVDIMQGWLHLNQEQTGKLGADLSQYLASPQLTRDLQTYLRNQSHGYAGDGRELARPADAREGTITPQDDAYKPATLPSDKAQVINLLMGMEQPGKQSPGQEFARRFAEANGIEAPRVNGVTDTNPLRARLRTEMGFDPKILNAAVEVLKTNRIVDLKERPDLHFNAGDTAFQRAGFMPQLAGPRLEHSVKDKTLSLVHYGDQGLREIGTKHFGRSGLTPGSELAGEPRSYWYVQGKENKHDPVLGRGAKYEASVSGNRIYDGDADPLDYGSVINRSKADSMLQDAGYSGIARTGRGGYRQVELFEPVKPENVQQTRKAASFMPNAEPAEPFYSPLEKTLRALPEKANRGQIEAALRGTKAEEMRDVKDPAGQTFEEYLKQHPEAGKQELLDFASQHKVAVAEKTLGGEAADAKKARIQHLLEVGAQLNEKAGELTRAAEKYYGYSQLDAANLPGRIEDQRVSIDELPKGLLPYVDRYILANRAFNEANRDTRKQDDAIATKYENYVLPGGSNYREQVFTLPNDGKSVPHNAYLSTFTPEGAVAARYRWLLDGQAVSPEFISGAAAHAWRNKAAPSYSSPHFNDVPNYLAHARYNERESPEGSVLHAEEIQSDLHQEGRKSGYPSNENRSALEAERDAAKLAWVKARDIYVSAQNALAADGYKDNPLNTRLRKVEAESKTEMDGHSRTVREINQRLDATMSRIPNAPFKKSWHELVFKNLLRTAAEKGKDWLSWTTGEQQAKRYGLSKSIQRVTLQKALGHSDKLYLSAHDLNGRRVVDKMIDGPKQVEDYIGKEAAKKLVEQPWTPYTEETSRGGSITHDHKQLSGLDLKVGGEGMKGFYDQILPRFADKYLKKYGVKTEKLPLSTGYTDPALKRYVGDGKGSDQLIPTKVHAVRITPEMRKDILEKGQPLYMPQTDKLSDFKADTLLEALKRPGWAVVTGTQEAQGSPDAPANVAANAKLEKHLQDKRIPYQKVGGSYKGVDQGPSFLIHANEEQAQKLSKQYGQESVLTSRGLLYQNGSITPAVSTDTKVGAEAAKQDFHSTLLDGTPFSVGLDFSQRISPSDLSKARVSAPRRGRELATAGK